jgi:hypothetical protein
MNSNWDKFKASGGFSNPNNLGLFIDVVLQSGFVGGGAGAVIVAIVFFFIMYALSIRLPRAVWMWDNEPKDEPPGGCKFEASKVIANPGEYLAWAKQHHVNATWIDVVNMHEKVAALGNFLKLAKAQGMTTQFIFGTAGAQPADPMGLGLADLVKVLLLIGKLDPAIRPMGVQSDLEHGMLFGSSDASTAFAAHVKYKEKVDTYNIGKVQKLKMVASVLYWWIKFEAETKPPLVDNKDYGYDKKEYGSALLALGWDVTVQDYRKPSWAQAPAVAWCDAAAKVGRVASIGMSLGPPEASAYNYDGAINDPLEEDGGKIANLEADLTALATSCMGNLGFAGMAVHDSCWYGAKSP